MPAEQAEVVVQHDLPNSAMVFVGGSKTSFRCEDCGANVFTKRGQHKYACNGCEAVYKGTPYR